jgi:hypothetical protein
MSEIYKEPVRFCRLSSRHAPLYCCRSFPQQSTNPGPEQFPQSQVFEQVTSRLRRYQMKLIPAYRPDRAVPSYPRQTGQSDRTQLVSHETVRLCSLQMYANSWAIFQIKVVDI